MKNLVIDSLRVAVLTITVTASIYASVRISQTFLGPLDVKIKD